MGLLFNDDGSIAEDEVADVATVVPGDMIKEWLRLKVAKNEAEYAELTMRRAIIETFFAGQAEGSKTKKDTDGNSIGATIVVNRTIDKELLTVRAPQFAEQGIALDALIRYKPELVVGVYKKLSDQQRAVFDEVLTITDGTPQLKCEPPKPKRRRNDTRRANPVAAGSPHASPASRDPLRG